MDEIKERIAYLKSFLTILFGTLVLTIGENLKPLKRIRGVIKMSLFALIFITILFCGLLVYGAYKVG